MVGLPPGRCDNGETNFSLRVPIVFICDVGEVVDGDGVPLAAAGGDDAPVTNTAVEDGSGGESG